MFQTRTEKVESSLVDVDKFNTDYCRFLTFVGYWSISEELVKYVSFQSGFRSSGSLNGVLVGSHYNWTWAIHLSKCISGWFNIEEMCGLSA